MSIFSCAHTARPARVYFFTEGLTEFLLGNVKSTKSCVFCTKPYIFAEAVASLASMAIATPLQIRVQTLQLTSAAFEQRGWEMYALENVVFYIEVYGPYKPSISIYATCNVQTHLKSIVM